MVFREALVEHLTGITSMEYQSQVDLQGNMSGHSPLASPLITTTRFTIVRVLNTLDLSRLHSSAMTIIVNQPSTVYGSQMHNGWPIIDSGMAIAVQRASAARNKLTSQSHLQQAQRKILKFDCVPTSVVKM